ncbi:LysR family transcriptional regulator [Phenylobacterium sp.]|jgi:LysR family carnitine catabolism transcriptional activator|uniref:LysR family transcriptional regulator n=1 Tax=Phenylobacterium sp. TaxID=1871053 RepID=UPI002F400149
MRRSPSLTSLRLFMEVAQSRSFSETARLVNVSQPALSRTIRLLEEQLGQRLFDRDTRNVALTAAGEALLPVVTRLTVDFDDAFSELEQSFAGQRGRVVVGALPSVAAFGLPRALADFRDTHPRVEILLRDDLSGALYQQMRERQIDFAITIPPDEAHEFAFDHIYSDPCVLICRPDDPLSKLDTASWSVFTDRPFIAMAPKSSVRALTDAALARAGATARPLFECAHIGTVGGLVDAGHGISALPHSSLPLLQSGRLVWRPLDDPLAARAIGVARVEKRTPSPAAGALIQHLLAELRKRRRTTHPSR